MDSAPRAMVIVRLRGEQIRSNPFVQAQNVTSLKEAELPQGNADNVEESNRSQNEVDKRTDGGGGGVVVEGGYGWGWGGGGGGGGGWGGGGGGSGGGRGDYWGWGCKKQPGKRWRHFFKKRGYQSDEDYKMGEFAQCMVRGRCMGMRLDCPLHCGGPCFYDCRYMCKAHCKN